MADNTYLIDADNAGQRFDKFLIRQFPVGGKGFVYKMLRKKRVKLNGGRALGNEILAEGDEVALFISPETQEKLYGGASAERMNPLCGGRPQGGKPAKIIYEDEHVLIVNKPANCLTHPDLTDWAAAHCKPAEQNESSKIKPFSPVAVNRLDRNTTGVVMLAKTLPAARELSLAIKERRVTKLYMALADGIINESMVLRGFHAKDKRRNVAEFKEAGKEAITEIRPIKHIGGTTLLEINLVTGRSHQIRAHLQSIGHPIIGDIKYGGVQKYGAKHQMLHAYKVRAEGLSGGLEYLNGREFISEPDWSV